jgi:hypothetical protein
MHAYATPCYAGKFPSGCLCYQYVVATITPGSIALPDCVFGFAVNLTPTLDDKTNLAAFFTPTDI